MASSFCLNIPMMGNSSNLAGRDFTGPSEGENIKGFLIMQNRLGRGHLQNALVGISVLLSNIGKIFLWAKGCLRKKGQ